MSIVWNGICEEGLTFFYPSEFWMLLLLTVTVCSGVVVMIREQKEMRIRAATAGVVAAVIGMYGAQDLFTAFVCFEIAGFLSCFWLTGDGEGKKVYLMWQVITGMILTMGMFLIDHHMGTLTFTQMAYPKMQTGWIFAAVFCCIIGYGYRCGIILLHSWMESALPRMSDGEGYLTAVLLMPSGLWGIYQIVFGLCHGNDQWDQILLFLGFLTVVAAAFKCLLGKEARKVLGAVAMAEIGWLLCLMVFAEKSMLWMVIIGYVAAMSVCSWSTKTASHKSLLFLVWGIQMIVVVLYKFPWMCLLAGIIVCIALWQADRVWSGKEGIGKVIDLEWCSLERLLYRPVFQKALPFFFGVLFRALDQLPDRIVALLRGTIYRDSKQRVWDKVGTPFTYVAGVVCDEIILILNKTILYGHPIKKSFVNGIAVAKKELETTSSLVARSVSFGLMLFSIGLFITLVYLLF